MAMSALPTRIDVAPSPTGSNISSTSTGIPRTQSLALHLDMLTGDEALLADFSLQGKQPYVAEDFTLLKVLGQGGFGKVSRDPSQSSDDDHLSYIFQGVSC